LCELVVGRSILRLDEQGRQQQGEHLLASLL
jgi:hypothetical protein